MVFFISNRDSMNIFNLNFNSRYKFLCYNLLLPFLPIPSFSGLRPTAGPLDPPNCTLSIVSIVCIVCIVCIAPTVKDINSLGLRLFAC